MGQKSDHSINKAKSSIYLIILFLCLKWVTKNKQALHNTNS
jgi:hypothetical protein